MRYSWRAALTILAKLRGSKLAPPISHVYLSRRFGSSFATWEHN